jgi:ankyrin repeat protein
MNATPENLTQAIRAGDLVEVGAILAADPQLAAAADAASVHPLVLAAYHGKLGIAEAIAAHRAELDLPEALVLGRREALLEILARAPALASAYAADGFSMLGLAVFFGRIECAALLLGAGADVDAAATNPMRVAPVHAAAAQADEALSVRLMRLLLAFGANPDAAQQAGWTALHSAAHRDYPQLVRLLLDAGANRELTSDDGRTALAMAIGENRTRAIAAFG